MGSFISVLLCTAAIIGLAFLIKRRREEKERKGRSFNAVVNRIANLWNGASTHMRDIMLLESAGLESEAKRVGLIPLRWHQLPSSVQNALFRMQVIAEGSPSFDEFRREFNKQMPHEEARGNLTPSSPGTTRSNSQQPESKVIAPAPAQLIATQIANCFSSPKLHEFLSGESLAPEWSYEDALAVWYSLGNLALVIVVWRTYRNKQQDTANQLIDNVRGELLKHWNIGGAMFRKIQSVVDETEKEAVKAFTGCQSADDIGRFFMKYMSRILGSPVPFSTSDIEDVLGGFRNLGKMPKNIDLCNMFIELTTGLKTYLLSVSTGVGA